MNFIERMKFYRSLDTNEKHVMKTMVDIYYLLKIGVQGQRPPPTTYQPQFENNNPKGKIVPTSDIPLEERVAGISNELRRIFDFALEHPNYNSKKLRYILDHYSRMYEDYLNHFLD